MNKAGIYDMNGLTISVPLFFNADESIDFTTLDRYLDDVCANQKISAIYSMAYNTRYRMLTDEEVYIVNSTIVNKCNFYDKDVYIGHPYSFNRNTLINYFERIKHLNISGISMLYPERYFGNDEVIIEFLKLPNEFGLKTVLHEMKLISGYNGELMNWPLELLNRVFEDVNLSAVKEDSKDDQIALTVLELCKKKKIHFVLAGGGKERALKFFKHGIETWLNGSSMFLPKYVDTIYNGFINNDEYFINSYLREIEKPFFEKIVNRFGWHLSHKAALEFFGYGIRRERFPHAEMSQRDYESVRYVFDEIAQSECLNFETQKE